MRLKELALGVILVSSLMAGQGCALFFVGAVAGAAAGTVSYVGNELRTTQDVGLDKAWSAANATLQEMQFPMVADKTYKDATGGTLTARTAKDQQVRVQLLRISDRNTEIRIRVGAFDTSTNRAAAQLVWDKMKARL
jgi:hypothetical protein